jgi:hypothetical protein
LLQKSTSRHSLAGNTGRENRGELALGCAAEPILRTADVERARLVDRKRELSALGVRAAVAGAAIAAVGRAVATIAAGYESGLSERPSSVDGQVVLWEESAYRHSRRRSCKVLV